MLFVCIGNMCRSPMAEAIARAKAAVAAAEPPVAPGLIEEAHLFNECLAVPAARKRMQDFLEQGGQTREFEAGNAFALEPAK